MVVAGINIATTLSNMFSIVYIAMGSAIGMILGQLLGAGKYGRSSGYRYEELILLFCGKLAVAALLCLMIIVSPFFPQSI